MLTRFTGPTNNTAHALGWHKVFQQVFRKKTYIWWGWRGGKLWRLVLGVVHSRPIPYTLERQGALGRASDIIFCSLQPALSRIDSGNGGFPLWCFLRNGICVIRSRFLIYLSFFLQRKKSSSAALRANIIAADGVQWCSPSSSSDVLSWS